MRISNLLIVILLLLLEACNTHHTHDHDLQEDPPVLIFTAYGDHFELFAEADPFVHGVSSKFRIHLTNLTGFKPVTDARISIKLTQTDSSYVADRAKFFKPGIYTSSIQPKSIGKQSLVFEVVSGFIIDRFQFNDIEVHGDQNTAFKLAENLHIQPPNAISFTKEYSWNIDFETSLVAEDYFGPVIKTVGQVLPTQQDEFVITAKSNGTIILQQNFYPGQLIRPRQLLARISAKGYADGNLALQYTEAKNNLDRLTSDYERIHLLHMQQIIPEKELLRVKNELDNARALYNNLSHIHHESGEGVVSESGGYLREILVNQGQYVSAGQLIAKVSQQKNFMVKLYVPPRYFDALGMIDNVILRSVGETRSFEALSPKKIIVGRELDGNNHLIPISFEFESIGTILPGLPIDIYIKTKTEDRVLVVQNTALIEESGTFFVYVQLHPELFEKRQVWIGETDGIHTVVMRGLAKEERIVSKGAVLVRAASAVGSIDPHAGHVH